MTDKLKKYKIWNETKGQWAYGWSSDPLTQDPENPGDTVLSGTVSLINTIAATVPGSIQGYFEHNYDLNGLNLIVPLVEGTQEYYGRGDDLYTITSSGTIECTLPGVYRVSWNLVGETSYFLGLTRKVMCNAIALNGSPFGDSRVRGYGRGSSAEGQLSGSGEYIVYSPTPSGNLHLRSENVGDSLGDFYLIAGTIRVDLIEERT